MVTGKFTIVFHYYRNDRTLNHIDIFLRPPNYDYLISYKLPKKNIRQRAELQKNHGLDYLTYEGDIHQNREKIRILKKGIFIAHPWIVSPALYNFATLTLYPEKITKNQVQKINDMWKKTDFKIAIDEIKLYEIAGEVTPAATESNLTKPAGEPAPQTPLESVPEDTAIILPQPVQTQAPVDTFPIKPLAPEQPQETTIAAPKPEPGQASQVSSDKVPAPVEKIPVEKEIEFVPIQEMVLDESGKTTGEYKLTP